MSDDMRTPEFVAINPDVSLDDNTGELEYYGESDLSIFDAVKSFKRANMADVARALGVEPGGIIQVQVWSMIAFQDSEYFDPEYPEEIPFDSVMDKIKGKFNLVWEGNQYAN